MKQLKSQQKHKDIQDIVLLADRARKDSRIDLNPAYQRNVIWDTERKAGFINSILKGINSHHLIFNIDSKGNMICMDGKQRINSIIGFTNNEFPVTYDGIIYYYSEIPDDIDSSKVSVLADEDRLSFDRFKYQ